MFNPMFNPYDVPDRTTARPLSLIGSLVALTGIWALIMFFYAAPTFTLLGGNCGPQTSYGLQPGTWHGGGYSSFATAAALGGVLWAAAGVAAWRIPNRRRGLLLAYAVLYVAAVIVLWYGVSPSVWGHQHCVIPNV